MVPPFAGQLQIAETGHARALSIDGNHWEVQFRFGANGARTDTGPSNLNDQLNRYTAVAQITPNGLVRLPLAPVLDTEAVNLSIDHLSASISNSNLPFTAIDRYEYWLLDHAERKPLALLDSCINEEEIGTPSVRPTWTAMPAAQLKIKEEATDQREIGLPPVNAQLESLIAERAGPSPRATWFDRAKTTTAFPSCLISEDWEQAEHNRICQLYIRRLAPRLLMLQGLEQQNRQRLEQACRENAIDVERFHRLYPEFMDQKLLIALLVEARIRNARD